jgi:hypothetical protein
MDMSEYFTDPLPPQGPTSLSDLRQKLNEVVETNGGQIADTHTRFVIKQEGCLDVVLEDPDTDKRQRLLVTQKDSQSDLLYDKLGSAEIPQFPRIDNLEGLTLYELPLQVKALGYERFRAEKPSTVTYLSDGELLERMGGLWRRIHNVSGRIPSQPLDLTAIGDFSDPDKMLTPIPPYSTWEKVSDESVALAMMVGSLVRGLETSNPGVEHLLLIEAVIKGWQNDRLN